ncbi:MAG: bifunctional (p)ppGpp synthetase/guanosine-3',5'-bis(diphosphate) 3'-pyrophosphohydrolase [Pseudomonadota bacterium]
MMRQYELVERVLSYDATADEAMLNRAYVYAMRAHGTQKRASGDPYFSHPLEVAAILTDLKLDDATIATALLHDVIEDTEATRAEIDARFGPEIGNLVDGLTKIRRIDLVSKRAEQAENFRKLLVAISSDIRVLLVKLADRLHNMRTLGHVREEKRQRISEETLEIYAPLAGRMGMQGIREELEDLAFCWLNPKARDAVRAKLDDLRKSNAGIVDEILQALRMKLQEAGVDAEVSGRQKKPFSIWRKMKDKQISLEQLSDIYAFRVLTAQVPDCYRALGVVHTTWQTVPSRFKDYISTPKQNDYRSIHTTIVGPKSQRVELQIRTRAMHDVAEHGVAAHALYKDGVDAGGADTNPFSALRSDGAHRAVGAEGPRANPYQWLRKLVDSLLEGDNPEEFLEHTKLELFHDQVFCFTPKGRLIALPNGATAIDFAFAVHTDVGLACKGAIINGRRHPLSQRLRNGDEVEIQTTATPNPQAGWEAVAVTGKARSAIRRALRQRLAEQYAGLGRQLIADAFKRAETTLADQHLDDALARLPQKTVDELLVAAGRGELKAVEVVKAALPDATITGPKAVPRKVRNRWQRAGGDEGWFNLTKSIGLKFRWLGGAADVAEEDAARYGTMIRAARQDTPVTFEPGGAVPGDRIVGVLVPGKGIRVFQIHSPRLAAFEGEQWIDVNWDIDPAKPERFVANLKIVALNAPGTLGQIATTIGEADGNIDTLQMVSRAADFTEMLVAVEVWDLDHLNTIVAGLKARPSISSVERLFD